MEDRCMVVVLNWNGADETMACLASLARLEAPRPAVLVVDNGSTDRSVERIRRAFPDAELLALPQNLGFAAGCNAGFRRVLDEGFSYVLFLNNDTLVDPGFLSPLLGRLAGDSGVGIAVPKILYASMPNRIWYAGGSVNLATGRIAHEGLRRTDSPRYSMPGSTDYATGCCMAMRSLDFERFGGFDDGFSMYGEDVDLSLRVRHAGLRIAYEPRSRVWHKVSASMPGRPWRKARLRSAGTLRLLQKHGKPHSLAAFALLLPFRLAVSAMAMVLTPRLRKGGG